MMQSCSTAHGGGRIGPPGTNSACTSCCRNKAQQGSAAHVEGAACSNIQQRDLLNSTMPCVLHMHLQEVDPEVFDHLSRLAASPIDLAFPWIMSAFVTHLSPCETLLLWDRIIGFDSLLPLAVLAVAVMTFRYGLLVRAPH